MRKYALIGFLILAFSLIGFAQDSSKIKIEEFVLADIETSKTVIFVGDRFELKLEIIYPKDWGIEILTEDLEEGSVIAMLPDSVILEKTEISDPVLWDKYFMKIEAIYTLFYPEKKHKVGILVFPEELGSLKVRFKWIDEEDEELQEDVKVYEVDVWSSQSGRPSQFVEGVRTLLTDTSNRPRDSKAFSGNFLLKSRIGYIIGFVFILFGLFIPVRAAIQYFRRKRRGVREVSIKEFLKSEFQKLNSQISDNEFRRILRNVIGKKAGFNALALTPSEIKEKVVGRDSRLFALVSILEKYDELGYNAEAESVSKAESIETAKKVISDWIPDKWHERLRKKWIISKK